MPSYLIIGASRGLGYAWLQYLSQDPANIVVGLARTPATVEEQIAKDGIKNVHIIRGDMSSFNSLAKAAEAAIPLLPSGLDHLIVNGAHMDNKTTFMAPTEFALESHAQSLHDDFHASIDTNVLGVVYSINAFLPLVLKGTEKKVIVITTGMADAEAMRPQDDRSEGLPTQMAYCASKAAVNMVVAKFAAELQPKGVITLALSPGVVNTRVNQPTEEEMAYFQTLMTTFSKRYPHWKGPITPLVSIEAQKKVIDNLRIEDSGKFLSHKGNKEWL